MDSLCFDGLSAHYDKTRASDPLCFESALDWIASRFGPHLFNAVIEPGVGTGRIAIPLLKRGYSVTGIDISTQMLRLCTANAPQNAPLTCIVGDATNLPFPPGSFDLAVAAHLFYFIPNWRKAVQEILRVLRPGGALIMMSTGFGAEVPEMNDRYKALASQRGYIFPSYGASSTSEVAEYARSIGCVTERIELPDWKWTNSILAVTALDHLRNRAYSFLRQVPPDLHNAVLAEMVSEYDRPDLALNVENKIYLVVVTAGPNAALNRR